MKPPPPFKFFENNQIDHKRSRLANMDGKPTMEETSWTLNSKRQHNQSKLWQIHMNACKRRTLSQLSAFTPTTSSNPPLSTNVSLPSERHKKFLPLLSDNMPTMPQDRIQHKKVICGVLTVRMVDLKRRKLQSLSSSSNVLHRSHCEGRPVEEVQNHATATGSRTIICREINTRN